MSHNLYQSTFSEFNLKTRVLESNIMGVTRQFMKMFDTESDYFYANGPVRNLSLMCK